MLYSSKLYISITTSRSSALSICTPLIFEMWLISGVLFLILISLLTLQFFRIDSIHFLVTNFGKSLSSEIVSSKSTIFWNSIFIRWNYILCSKQFKVINNLLSFFWWNVNFFYFLCFFFFFWFTQVVCFRAL